jgi:hypothetical protein
LLDDFLLTLQNIPFFVFLVTSQINYFLELICVVLEEVYKRMKKRATVRGKERKEGRQEDKTWSGQTICYSLLSYKTYC